MLVEQLETAPAYGGLCSFYYFNSRSLIKVNMQATGVRLKWLQYTSIKTVGYMVCKVPYLEFILNTMYRKQNRHFTYISATPELFWGTSHLVVVFFKEKVYKLRKFRTPQSQAQCWRVWVYHPTSPVTNGACPQWLGWGTAALGVAAVSWKLLQVPLARSAAKGGREEGGGAPPTHHPCYQSSPVSNKEFPYQSPLQTCCIVITTTHDQNRLLVVKLCCQFLDLIIHAQHFFNQV